MQITAIEEQKKDKSRCSLFVDGEFYCGLTYESVYKAGLSVGTEVDDELLESVRLESEKSEVLDKAMRHMSMSLKTEKELRRFLSEKGYHESTIEYAMEKLKSYGYVDDEAYCREFARCAKNKGKIRIAAELRARGVDSGLVDSVLSDYEDDQSEMDTALEKYMRGKDRDRKNKNKAFNYLYSRGYSSDDIRKAVDRFFADGDGDEDS